MLSENDIKEELSLSYVRAISARAGFSFEEIRKDRDSVDAKICARGLLEEASILGSPELSVQLKATVIDPLPDNEFSFSLPIKNYRDLTLFTMVPRILVVVIMPKNTEQWLSCSLESLIFRRCAFWKSLLGCPASDNTTTQAVRICRNNVLTPESLRTLLGKVARQEPLSP